MIPTQSQSMKRGRKKRPKKILGVTIDYNMPDYPPGPGIKRKLEEGSRKMREIGFPDDPFFKR